MSIASSRYQLDVRWPIAFLTAVLHFWSSDAFISFEGNLSFLDRTLLTDTSDTPTTLLSRNTLQPTLEFLIVPINAHTLPIVVRRILPQVGLRKRVIHIELAYQNQLVLGAYDQFHPECVWISAIGTDKLCTHLLEQRIIRRYYF